MNLSEIYKMEKSARVKALVEHKKDLIMEKKSMIKHTDVVVKSAARLEINKDGTTKAAESPAPNSSADSVRVQVVANTAWYFDSQYDVIMPDSAKKSMIPHLTGHVHQIEAKVGEVVNIFYQDIPLKELGWNSTGTTQALIFETDIYKSYNEKIFNQYNKGRINQHSIGLYYVELSLAINDEENEKEFDYWNKYIGNIINRAEAEEVGFMWLVKEYKLLENSCVLFGSNILTPTLDAKDTDDPPPLSTEVPPPPPPIDLRETIKTLKFFN
jgi:hypothetical protein